MTSALLTILGTAQDGGVPHPNCFCSNCMKAITDKTYKRFAASLAIVLPEKKQWHLIDATPDLKEQLLNLQIKYNLKGSIMDSIFLTHAHMGHFPGLLYLGRESISAIQLPVYAGNKLKDLLTNHAPWSQLTKLNNIEVTAIHDGLTYPISEQITIQPINVPHRNEFSETFGFWIKGPKKTVLYIPDIDRWDEWNIDVYNACAETDICILDGTFYSHKELEHITRDFREIPHPTIIETMERLQELTSHKEIYFTHFNHSNPALDENGKERILIEERGFKIANEGMEIQI